MRKVLLILLFVLFGMVSYSQTKYPIKTIFKGDSVVILTIQQSNNINKMIEKNSKSIKEYNVKIQEYESKIKELERVNNYQNAYIDSLSNVILECWVNMDTIRFNADTLLKQYEELNLTVYEMAVGPTLLYTLPPYKEVLFLNLKHFNMYTDPEGSLILVRMTPKEMKKYDEWRKKYGDESLMYIDYQKVIRFRDFQDDLIERIIWKNKRSYEIDK
jgi:uncharacterized coiled-coil protein SlyX